MALYTPPTLSGYNSSPPSDDGSATASNQVLWSTIKTKLADPLNTYAQAIDTRVSAVLTTNALDVDGNPIVLDADGDTKIDATSDDQVKVTIAGSTAGAWTSNGLAIGSTSSSGKLTVTGTGVNTAWFQMDDDGATSGPRCVLYRNSASPAANDVIGEIRFNGEDSAGNAEQYAAIQAEIIDPTTTSEDGRINFETVIAGTVSDRLYIGHGIYTPNATGGDKGADTINASAVYDDNVLLTCYVLEAWQDGAVTVDSWDNTIPGDRQHERARSFSTVATDRLDTEKFVEFLKAFRHLPALPSPAEWASRGQSQPVGDIVQRLWETVEVLAVHIAKMHDRLSSLETRRP